MSPRPLGFRPDSGCFVFAFSNSPLPQFCLPSCISMYLISSTGNFLKISSHVSSQKLWQHPQELPRFKMDKTRHEKGRWTQSSTPNQEGLVLKIWNLLCKEKSVCFFQWSTTSYINHTLGEAHVNRKRGLKIFCVCFWFWFIYSCIVIILVLILFNLSGMRNNLKLGG